MVFRSRLLGKRSIFIYIMAQKQFAVRCLRRFSRNFPIQYCCFGLLALFLSVSPGKFAQALEISALETQAWEKTYRLQAELILDAPLSAVEARLLDFQRLPQIATSIKEIRWRSLTPRRYEVFSRVESCVAFFCRGIERTERVHHVSQGLILAVTSDDSADFHFGRTEWRLVAQGEKTRLQHQTTVSPAIWIPPLIGDYLIKQRLESGFLRSMQRLENLAHD